MEIPNLPLRMTYPVVVRPSGVWNTRAPFGEYVRHMRRVGQQVAAIRVMVGMGRHYVRKVAAEGRGLRKHIDRDLDYGTRRALQLFGQVLDGEQRSTEALDRHAKRSLTIVREWRVIQEVAAFELFSLSWTLNYLLARLESAPRVRLTDGEYRLAQALSPLHGGTRLNNGAYVHQLPSWTWVLQQLPHLLARSVRTIPYRKIPIDGLTAFAVFDFWRAFRNHCVHRGRTISTSFVERHSRVWEILRADANSRSSYSVPQLQVGHGLPLPEYVMSSARHAPYQLAEHMNSVLCDASGLRRGHRNAPGPYVPGTTAGEQAARPLLNDGDHRGSLRALDQCRNWNSDLPGPEFDEWSDETDDLPE